MDPRTIVGYPSLYRIVSAQACPFERVFFEVLTVGGLRRRTGVGLFILVVSCISCADGRGDLLRERMHKVLPLKGEESGPTYVADPHVIKVGGTWYLYPTHTSEGVSV